MKLLKLIVLFFGSVLAITNVAAQANASLNILSLNSGQASVGHLGIIQVTVGNTGPNSIAAFKVRAQISVPTAIANMVTPAGNQNGLPPGWTVQTVSAGSIIVCNGTDVIPAGAQRQIFIKFQGIAAGGPSTINGSLLFSNGTTCAVTGTLAGDNTSDNTGTTGLTVVADPGCTLSGVSPLAGTIACNGGTTTLTGTASGAAGPVEFSESGGAFQPGNTFTVGAGFHFMLAREATNPTCLQVGGLIITEPSAITASPLAGTIACNGQTTTLSVAASGGTGSLEYSLNAGAYQPSGDFTVSAGTYNVAVRDANLCVVTPSPVTITEPSALTANGSVTTPIPTPGGEGTITVTSGGGTDPKTYVITTGTTINTTGATSGVFTNLLSGDYTFTATDGNSCNTTTATITLSDPVVTPVTLTEFSAALVNCKPVLHWKTETEINSDRFEIERSQSGNADWIRIGTVTAAGNAATTSLYSFSDAGLSGSAGKVFYRLNMIDKDGKHKHSDILRISLNCKTVVVDVYPNPVQNGKLYIGLTAAGENARAALLSLPGQVILKSKLHNGTNSLDVSQVANGIYILHVADQDGIDKKIKVRIQH